MHGKVDVQGFRLHLVYLFFYYKDNVNVILGEIFNGFSDILH